MDEGNEYEEAILTSSVLSSALAGSAVLLLSISPATIHIWKSLFAKTTSIIKYLQETISMSESKGCAEGRSQVHHNKYIGSISYEVDGFQRLYCGLSGCAQFVSQLNMCDGTTKSSISAKSPCMGSLVALRRDAALLVASFKTLDQPLYPLLLGQLRQIAAVSSDDALQVRAFSPYDVNSHTTLHSTTRPPSTYSYLPVKNLFDPE